VTEVSERPRAGSQGLQTPVTTSPSRTGVRADIQGLRALAVSSVVVFHFWPSLLPGGFTGVDVFFVVSGFLITGRILKDLERRTPASFVAHFWAARVRRILPAALLVLVVVLMLSWLLLPESRWEGLGQHVFASALSIENWQLAREAVDYGAEGAAVSPVQHYWSLSVEEQFYLGWPLLLLLASLIASRVRGVSRRGVLALLMGVVLVASLWYSFWVTANDPAAAYFVTPARVWQLAAGGLIALAAVRGVRVLPWVGLGMIALGFVLIDNQTAYPGIAAMLPTLGTCLVLLGGPTGPRSFDARVSPWAIQRLGDISYSVYLWHWPLVVLGPVALERSLTPWDTFVALCLTLTLAELTYRFVEQPCRSGWLLRLPSRSWMIGALSIAVIVGLAVKFEDVGDERVRTAAAVFEKQAETGGTCFGAAAMTNDCPDRFAGVAETVAIAGSDDKPIASRKPQCSDTTGPFTQVLCHYGDPDGKKTLLVWGNSHASAWSDAFDRAGKLLGIKVIVASRSSCPASLGTIMKSDLRESTEEEIEGCHQRNAWVVSEVVPQADIVVMADLRTGFVQYPETISGLQEAIAAVRRSGAEAILLGDVPLTSSVSTRRDGPECLEVHGQCTNAVDRALVATEVADKLQELVPDLPVIETRSQFCDDARCYAAIGGVSVYFDASHLTGTYSRSLGQWLGRELRTCIADPKSCTTGAGETP